MKNDLRKATARRLATSYFTEANYKLMNEGLSYVPSIDVTEAFVAGFNAAVDIVKKSIGGERKTLYIDMDNVLVDFQSGIDSLDGDIAKKYEGRYDETPNIFSLMKPVSGAVDAVKKLLEKYDVYILSTAPWNNIGAWSDKLLWVKKYFGWDERNPFYKKVVLTHHKNLCFGDYLIDDRPGKNGADMFVGQVLHFDPNNPDAEFKSWDEIVEWLMME